MSNNKKLMGAISWIRDRAQRSAEKIISGFCDEQKYDMGGHPIEMVRLIHTSALFEALRHINTPDYLISCELEVEDEVVTEYTAFLCQVHMQVQEIARTIREWEPGKGNAAMSAKATSGKGSHPGKN